MFLNYGSLRCFCRVARLGLLVRALNLVCLPRITSAVPVFARRRFIGAWRCDTIGGVEVEEGQIIGLLDRRVVVSGLSPADVLESLLEKAAVSQGDLVTRYRGEPLPHADAQSAVERVDAAFPDSEFELVEGDQPYYHFIVSIE